VTRDQDDVEKAWQGYLSSLPLERRVLLKRYRITDVALRVGGSVSSSVSASCRRPLTSFWVGTPCPQEPITTGGNSRT
jgi:hypothetical protein